MRRLALTVVVASALAAPALGAPKPSGTQTAAGMAAARRALIGAAALGPGWRPGGTPGFAMSLNCTNTVSLAVVEIGSAASATFEAGASGPFVSEVAFVYQSPSQARDAWSQVAGPVGLGCLAKSVSGIGASGVKFQITHRDQLSRPIAAARSSAYRLVLRAIAKDQKVTAYVDMLLVGRGATVTALSFAGFQQPVAASFELSLARTAARKLAG